MTKDEVLKMALEALEYHTAQTRPIIETMATISVIKEVLAQPEQEPVARLLIKDGYISVAAKMQKDGEYQLYASPPKRQPLTDSQILQLVDDCTFADDLHADKFVRAIEQAHGIGAKHD